METKYANFRYFPFPLSPSNYTFATKNKLYEIQEKQGNFIVSRIIEWTVGTLDFRSERTVIGGGGKIRFAFIESHSLITWPR